MFCTVYVFIINLNPQSKRFATFAAKLHHLLVRAAMSGAKSRDSLKKIIQYESAHNQLVI